MEAKQAMSASVNGRLQLLLKTHMRALQPEILHPPLGSLVIEQEQPADYLMLVQQGRLAVELSLSGQPARVLAEVTQGALLGEMAFFGEGRHSASVRVLEEPTELLRISRQALREAVLYDAELAAEMLVISSDRCRTANRLIHLLLDGIDACYARHPAELERVCSDLRQQPESLAKVAVQLEQLLAAKRS